MTQGSAFPPFVSDLTTYYHNTPPMKTYSVHVGNIGQVYSGPSRSEAFKHFAEYVSQSKTNYGRAAGESVVVMLNGTTLREHVGALDAAEAATSESLNN